MDQIDIDMVSPVPTDSAEISAAELSTKILIGSGEWSSSTGVSPAILSPRPLLNPC